MRLKRIRLGQKPANHSRPEIIHNEGLQHFVREILQREPFAEALQNQNGLPGNNYLKVPRNQKV